MTTDQQHKRQRFAIYTRYSSDMQNELSLEAQEARCREEIAKRGGAVVAVYSDGAKSGWSLDRTGFNDMRAAAERGKFDAAMFWKFDRLARNHDDAVVIKMLLRREYNLKLYCVEGFSEDDNDSPYAAMMEQMLAVFSAFYSRNLSSETKRGKRYRAVSGEFNGSIAPIGYDLVTVAQSTEDRSAGLYINPRIAAIVRRAFRMYSTGAYSDADIAQWMNERPVIQKLRQGQQPMNKETVRDMLQNRVYTGRVCYSETFYNGTLGEGKRSSRKRKEWFEGKHQGFISDELFDLCQDVRASLVRTRKVEGQMRTYILHDRVNCARCIANTPNGLVDKNYGKMRPYFHNQVNTAYYRCLAHDRGYEKCGQRAIPVDTIDNQVVSILSGLQIPENFKERIETEVRNRVENEAALQRIETIREMVERIDFSWENGFITPDDYVEKRTQLQREMEALKPIDYDDLIEAADLLQNFNHYWLECEKVGNPAEARQQLVSKIVERVFVYADRVIAVALYGDFAVVLGENETAPQKVVDAVRSSLEDMNVMSLETFSQCGSDGIRTRGLCLDRAVC